MKLYIVNIGLDNKIEGDVILSVEKFHNAQLKYIKQKNNVNTCSLAEVVIKHKNTCANTG